MAITVIMKKHPDHSKYYDLWEGETNIAEFSIEVLKDTNMTTIDVRFVFEDDSEEQG